ncbi:WD-40 repeat-containing protein [Reticulomyxa filosa]|uniref:WD-40 repeat-containing protein n=1 Tax=Reticulomyxa filosa TaxID=46433 RepID=X6M8U6_RETFI|nr:WD-40 repeat-containing protein [Reticulomyxa filosa]|eukprot:ETO10403.1 WD-40 repeat-containing protein [Reticulomyxa filosa]
MFDGHSDIVSCVKFSSYHRYYRNNDVQRLSVCSSSYDKTIRFWDFTTGKAFIVLSGHTDYVHGIEFSPFNNGRYVCSASSDKTIRLWDVETSKSLHVFNGHKSGVLCVDISQLQSSNRKHNNNNNNNNNNKMNNIGVIGGNGYTICSGSFDKTIRLWDLESAKQCSIFKGHEDAVYCAIFMRTDAGGTMLCSGSSDKTIRVWDIRSKKYIRVFRGHTNYVTCVACPSSQSGDMSVICSSSDDNTIRFWDIRANKELHAFKGSDHQADGIKCIQFLPSEDRLNHTTKSKLSHSDYHDYSLFYGSNKGPIYMWG